MLLTLNENVGGVPIIMTVMVEIIALLINSKYNNDDNYNLHDENNAYALSCLQYTEICGNA